MQIGNTGYLHFLYILYRPTTYCFCARAIRRGRNASKTPRFPGCGRREVRYRFRRAIRGGWSDVERAACLK